MIGTDPQLVLDLAHVIGPLHLGRRDFNLGAMTTFRVCLIMMTLTSSLEDGLTLGKTMQSTKPGTSSRRLVVIPPLLRSLCPIAELPLLKSS